MRFRAGPGFQSLTGVAEIEVRHGISRAFLKARFQGGARLLVVVLFQEVVTQRTFLDTLIHGGCGHGQLSIECEDRDDYEDLFHLAPLHVHGLITRHKAIDVPEVSIANFHGNLRDYLENYQVFAMAKGNTKAQNTISSTSAESILITL